MVAAIVVVTALALLFWNRAVWRVWERRGVPFYGALVVAHLPAVVLLMVLLVAYVTIRE